MTYLIGWLLGFIKVINEKYLTMLPAQGKYSLNVGLWNHQLWQGWMAIFLAGTHQQSTPLGWILWLGALTPCVAGGLLVNGEWMIAMVLISGHWLYARTLTYADLTLAAPCKQVLHFTGEQTDSGGTCPGHTAGKWPSQYLNLVS